MNRLDKLGEILKSYEGRELVSDDSLNCLKLQPRAYREPGKTDKALLFFDASQEKLFQEGYESHPSSAEAFAFICAYLDDQKRGKKLLTPEQTEVVKDMLTDQGEFFCQAVETAVVLDRLVARIYENVIVLPRNAANDGYTMLGMKSSAIRRFDITGLKLGERAYYKDIYVKHDALIKYLTSRKYEDLPDEIKENGVIILPSPGAVWPVGRDYLQIWCGISDFYGSWASRGVRHVQKEVAA